MQTSHLPNQFVSRPDKEVVRVGEDDGRAKVVGKVALGEPFDGRLRAHRHEDRRFNIPVRRVQDAGAGAGVRTLGYSFERDASQIRLYARGITASPYIPTVTGADFPLSLPARSNALTS